MCRGQGSQELAPDQEVENTHRIALPVQGAAMLLTVLCLAILLTVLRPVTCSGEERGVKLDQMSTAAVQVVAP